MGFFLCASLLKHSSLQAKAYDGTKLIQILDKIKYTRTFIIIK